MTLNTWGHFWTIMPWARTTFLSRHDPPSRPLTVVVPDETWGSVRLSGRWHAVPHDDRLVIVVHGLGGCSESHYARRAAHAVAPAGLSCLRLGLRGADRSGEDLYHAGLTADLEAAIASEAASKYERIMLLGYSLGGHIVLRYACSPTDERVRAVAAVCAPLDLESAVDAFDRHTPRPYRWHVMSSLRSTYAAIARRGRGALPVSETARIRTIREWDERVVAPRFGFRDAHDYYETSSVGPVLRGLRVPALLVASEGDPMVRPETVRPSLTGAPGLLDTRWVNRGGHVGFPGRLDLGEDGPPGLEAQALSWLMRHAPREPPQGADGPPPGEVGPSGRPRPRPES